MKELYAQRLRNTKQSGNLIKQLVDAQETLETALTCCMLSKALELGADSQCDFINTQIIYQVTEKTHIFNKHFNKPHSLF